MLFVFFTGRFYPDWDCLPIKDNLGMKNVRGRRKKLGSNFPQNSVMKEEARTGRNLLYLQSTIINQRKCIMTKLFALVIVQH